MPCSGLLSLAGVPRAMLGAGRLDPVLARPRGHFRLIGASLPDGEQGRPFDPALQLLEPPRDHLVRVVEDRVRLRMGHEHQVVGLVVDPLGEVRVVDPVEAIHEAADVARVDGEVERMLDRHPDLARDRARREGAGQLLAAERGLGSPRTPPRSLRRGPSGAARTISSRRTNTGACRRPGSAGSGWCGGHGRGCRPGRDRPRAVAGTRCSRTRRAREATRPQGRGMGAGARAAAGTARRPRARADARIAAQEAEAQAAGVRRRVAARPPARRRAR